MNLFKKGDTVLHEGDLYSVYYVWNHGGNLIYYDLIEVGEKAILGFRRTVLSVHQSDLKPDNSSETQK